VPSTEREDDEEADGDDDKGDRWKQEQREHGNPGLESGQANDVIASGQVLVPLVG